MIPSRAIVVGAGLAGLAAAVALREAGVAVSLSDAAAHAGGRCRSYHDPALGLTIDNGNHLVLSGNPAVAAYRAAIGASAPLAGPAHADFAFADLAGGARWRVRINDGRVPWWVFARDRRVPGTGWTEYARLAGLSTGAPGATVRDRIDPVGTVWDKLLHPVLLAALNTEPAEASAALAARVLRESLGRGGNASRPRIAEPTLSAAFVDPALDWLAARGARLACGRRLRAIEFAADRVTALEWSDGREAVADGEAVILAVPAWVAAALVPGLAAPTEHRAIVNGHFAWAHRSSPGWGGGSRVAADGGGSPPAQYRDRAEREPPPAAAPRLPPPPIGEDRLYRDTEPALSPTTLGLFGGTAEWLFVHRDRVSVTVSAADALLDRSREDLARAFWVDVQRALGVAAPLPAWQIVKERRATFAATPAQDALRPPARTCWRNLFVAGDWVQTGLPATIEGALRAGDTAARLALGRAPRYRAPRC